MYFKVLLAGSVYYLKSVFVYLFSFSFIENLIFLFWLFTHRVIKACIQLKYVFIETVSLEYILVSVTLRWVFRDIKFIPKKTTVDISLHKNFKLLCTSSPKRSRGIYRIFIQKYIRYGGQRCSTSRFISLRLFKNNYFI